MSQVAIEGQRLNYRISPGPNGHILRDLNFNIKKGEFVALIGPNGAGKSTLAQILAGLIKPTSGLVTVNGRVGMVFQFPEQQLFAETVREDLAFGPENLGLSPDEIVLRVERSMELVGLKVGYLERSPWSLSGGEKRRVAIAGILAMDPDILIFDEPTAGLDPSGRTGILNLIGALNSKEGRTVLMVSHEMDEVAMLASRVMVLKGGELLKAGEAMDILSDTRLIEEAGLLPPWTVRLGYALNNRGMAVRCHLDMEGMVGEVVRAFRRRR